MRQLGVWFILYPVVMTVGTSAQDSPYFADTTLKAGAMERLQVTNSSLPNPTLVPLRAERSGLLDCSRICYYFGVTNWADYRDLFPAALVTVRDDRGRGNAYEFPTADHLSEVHLCFGLTEPQPQYVYVDIRPCPPCSDPPYTSNPAPRPLMQYTLTVLISPLGVGWVNVSPDPHGYCGHRHTYLEGQEVTLTAACPLPWRFKNWSGDLSSSDNPATFVMGWDKSVTAVFEKQYMLKVTVSPPGAGTVSRDPDRATYTKGDSVTLTASQNAGYKFKNWSGSIWRENNPLTITMNDNMSITANFENREAPVIVDVRSAYCEKAKHVYYIEGVWLHQDFTVEVDWRKSTAGHVRWYRSDRLVATDYVGGNTARRSFNMGTNFAHGERLYVQAVTANGIESEKYAVNFDVIESPPCVPIELLTAEIGNVGLTYVTPGFSLRWPNFDAELPENDNVLNPENTAGIRSIGTTSFDTIVEVSAEIDGSTGTCTIGIKTDKLGKKEWENKTLQKGALKLAGVDIDAQLWVNIVLVYQSRWVAGGGIGWEVVATKEFGPKYLIFMDHPVFAYF